MGKWSKYAKRILCMLLSTVMVLTDAGMCVSATESTAAVEIIEENLLKETEEGTNQEKTTVLVESAAESKVEETTKETESQASEDSVTSETESAVERTKQGITFESEESTIGECTEEFKTETALSVETVTETAVVEETRTEAASPVETVTETAEVEESQTEETTEEDIQTEETLEGETEIETEVQESETQEVLAEDVIAQGTYKEDGNDITWVIDLDGKLTVTGTGEFAPDDDSIVSSERAPWKRFRKEIKSAEINVTGMTNACSMFWGCSEMTTVDLSSFDTSRIMHMGGMFAQCTSLESLDLSSFDTSNVIYMTDMFDNCNKLTDLNLSSFDTHNVEDMQEMFIDCKSLRYLDLSSFELWAINRGHVYDIFRGCNALIELKTPRYVSEDGLGQLPQGAVWKDSDGKKYTYFPVGSNSVTLTKEEIEGIIAYGEYKENGNVTTWEVNNDGNLSLIGYGEFAPSGVSSIRAPWYDYRDSIKTAEIHVQGMTNASGMFFECRNMVQVDLRDFDTTNITDMSTMFQNCSSLETLDLNNFNTENVIDMRQMFKNCYSLTCLNVSGFDTKNVKNVWGMFYGCKNLTNLNISTFDTSNMINMREMFYGCQGLTNLDLSNFDTKNTICIDYMFGQCITLVELNLSNFNTSNILEMTGMFQGCSSLINLDVSGFNISKVENMDFMFSGCNSLTSLDLSSFDARTVFNMYGMFDGCEKLTLIKTPKNVTTVLELPNGIWHDTNGNEYTNLPQNLSVSVLLRKENTKAEVNLTGIDTKDYTYSKKPVSPTVLAMTADGTDVTSAIKDILVCTYTGTQADGTEYATTNEAPTNAGEYTLTAVIPEDSLDYIGGSQTFDFTIRKAQVTITASDISLTTGAALPKPEDYKYTLSSPATEEDLEKKPTLTCSITDISKEGTYDIVIADAALKVNPNYEAEIKYINGKVEVTAYYTVTFDLSGKGESTTQENIKKGSTISQPADPQAEGFTFTGWYKDKECTIKWDFASDKIESNTTLYAGWKAKDDDDKDDDNKDDDKDDSSEDKDDSAYTSQERVTLSSVSAEIAAIKSRVYDGTAYRPGVRVTAIADGRKVTLTEGTDYRVLYKNNINAGQATVTVKGNGIYKGECSKNFTITAKPINKLKIITGGVTLGSSIQNLPVYVYDGAVLLKSGTDYTLSGYSAGTSTASVTVTGKANYTGTATAKLTVYSVSSDKIINPENVTLNVQSVPYTGKSIKNVEPTVRIGGTTLVKNKDYKVQYQNNKNAGTAFVIVTGKGAYKGKAVVPFTIKAVNAGSMNIKPLSVKTYNGKLQKPAVTVTVNGNKLSKDKDYTVTYKNNLHAGTATVIVTGKGNYAGMKGEAKFTINPQKISKASVKGTQGNLTLTYSKRTLKEGADYEKPIYGSASKNKIKVTIKGKNDFTGEVTKSVKIH